MIKIANKYQVVENKLKFHAKLVYKNIRLPKLIQNKSIIIYKRSRNANKKDKFSAGMNKIN